MGRRCWLHAEIAGVCKPGGIHIPCTAKESAHNPSLRALRAQRQRTMHSLERGGPHRPWCSKQNFFPKDNHATSHTLQAAAMYKNSVIVRSSRRAKAPSARTPALLASRARTGPHRLCKSSNLGPSDKATKHPLIRNQLVSFEWGAPAPTAPAPPAGCARMGTHRGTPGSPPALTLACASTSLARTASGDSAVLESRRAPACAVLLMFPCCAPASHAAGSQVGKGLQTA